ncbi:MAG: TraB/GumN family protein [Acidobacteria bacterium]|nr:MAG: TraB/GumN family protein [Acidobacteriota bacterium]
MGAGHITELSDGERRFFLVGTAHVSRRSVEEVREAIDRLRPDAVCVELDENRYRALVDGERWRRLDIFQVIKERKVPFLLVSLALAAYQQRLGNRFGVRPGAEMIAAIDKAKEHGARLVLADRDIQITLRRAWRRLGPWRRLRLGFALLAGAFADEELTEQELERIKESDVLAELMREFTELVPEVKGPLIDERDAYLVSRIREAPGRTVVAVVGAAHVPGMVARFADPIDRAALESVPPPGPWGKILKWLLPALILAAFAVGYRRHAGEGLREMLFAWLIPNSVLAALFSLLAGARLLSVVTAFVASPITSLNPTIAAGMVVGLVEAWLRRPTVEDCERLREDAQTLRGLYRNRFTRVLLVSLMASLGSALGAWIGGTWVVTLLSR